MPPRRKPPSLARRATYRCVEVVIGCKWSAAVVGARAHGVNRPGALERYVPGISTKVLNERLRRLVGYRLVTRPAHTGLPLRVEYTLTPQGARVAALIEELQGLNQELG